MGKVMVKLVQTWLYWSLQPISTYPPSLHSFPHCSIWAPPQKKHGTSLILDSSCSSVWLMNVVQSSCCAPSLEISFIASPEHLSSVMLPGTSWCSFPSFSSSSSPISCNCRTETIRSLRITEQSLCLLCNPSTFQHVWQPPPWPSKERKMCRAMIPSLSIPGPDMQLLLVWSGDHGDAKVKPLMKHWAK